MSRIVVGEHEWRRRIHLSQTPIPRVDLSPRSLQKRIRLQRIDSTPQDVAEKVGVPMYHKDRILRAALSSPAVLSERHKSRLMLSRVVGDVLNSSSKSEYSSLTTFALT